MGLMIDVDLNPLVNKLVDPENHQCLMETSLPTPMTERVYVNLPEGTMYIYICITICILRNAGISLDRSMVYQWYGKGTKSHGRPAFLVGNSTINGHFQ